MREEIFEFDTKYGGPQSLLQRLSDRKDNRMQIAAEFKRASPSKGDINIALDAAEQCLKYANMGASVLSVLTEFRYFKGNLRDMKNVRLAVQKAFPESASRPLVLRKDFIFDRYQILEARAHGADTLLLIVAVLGRQQLNDLLSFSRSLKMEPLVEVNTPLEMEIALDAGATCIGINNRNLHTFQLDLMTTERCLEVVQRRKGSTWSKDGSLCIAALSGITDAHEVRTFQELGVQCVLVGEALMKAADPAAKIRELLSTETAVNSEQSDKQQKSQPTERLLKVCGMVNSVEVQGVLSAGANLIGVIMVPSSPRFIQTTTKVKEIVDIVRRYGERTDRLPAIFSHMATLLNQKNGISVGEYYSSCMSLLQRITQRRPLSVAVIRDETQEQIKKIVEETGCDLIQLHGNESPLIVSDLSIPVIKVLHIDIDSHTNVQDQIRSTAKDWQGKAIALLLDAKSSSASSSGGLGQPFPWQLLEGFDEFPVLLAGGINIENVSKAVGLSCVGGLDVSSGVEITPGQKDLNKVRNIVQEVRKA